MLSFAIVNYRTRAFLPPLLESIERFHAADVKECIIVDNASGDDLGDVVAPYPWARVVQSERNGGYGAGINRAFTEIAGDWLVCVNPDVQFQGPITPVLADRPATVAAVAVATRSGSTGAIETNGGEVLRLRTAWRRKQVSAAAQAVARGEETDVEWAGGAVFAVRRAVFAAVGGFDQQFFMYFEDMDLCRRIRTLGLGSIRWSPTPLVVHAIAGSGGDDRRRREWYYRSQRHYLSRWGHPLLARLLVPLHALLMWQRRGERLVEQRAE